MSSFSFNVDNIKVQSFATSGEAVAADNGGDAQSLTNCSDSSCCDWTDATGTCQVNTPSTETCTEFPC